MESEAERDTYPHGLCGCRVLEPPDKGLHTDVKTMYDSNPNDLEGTDVLKNDIEETILRHCWTNTDECPACGCESALRIGVETEGEEIVSAPDCQLCDAVVRTIADGMEFDLT